MKLNYDCVKNVLLYLEENLGYTENTVALEHKRLSIFSIINNIDGYTKENVQYTIEKLEEAKYIRFTNVTYDSQKYIINGYVDDITWDGFEFLDNVREKKRFGKQLNLVLRRLEQFPYLHLAWFSTKIIKAIIANPAVIADIISKLSL